MNDNILISAGILHTYWEQNKRDVLDLLMPFLKCSISDTTQPNGEIKVDVLAEYFCKEYGYEDIPIHIISIMLRRLSPSIITIEKGKYYLTGQLENEVAEFNKKKLSNKEHREKVIEALKNHLTTAFPKERFSSEEVGTLLYYFFTKNGLCLARTTDNLIAIKQKDDPVNYEVAKFIMKEYKAQSSVFDYVYDMVQGFFVSTAIYLPKASTSLQTKMRGVSCYIDTRIIINALGMHLPTQVKSGAVEFLDMLKNAGAGLFCFRHNYEEIVGVLTAYKGSLQNIKNRPVTNTLEAFDELSYTANDVDKYILRLPKRIEALGIIIVDAPEYDNSYNKTAYIDVSGLEETLKQEMKYNPKSEKNAVQTDANSAAAIMLLRNGELPIELEKSKYIFISSSNKYCNIVEKFINPQKRNVVPVAYSELHLAALLWLRNYSAHKDYPKNKLIENAMLTLDIPSSKFLNGLFDSIDLLQSQGDLTSDEAAILRMDSFTKKEMLKETRGDSASITKDSLLMARDRLKKRYLGDEVNKAKLDYDRYMEQKKSNDTAKKNATNEINRTGEEALEKERKKLNIISKCIFIFFAVIVIGCLIIGIIGVTWWQIAIGIVLLIVDILGFVDFIKDKKKTVSKWIEHRAQKVADKAMDIKREEYERVFGTRTD